MCGMVQLNGYLTNWFDISSGVRQGDVLSTTLFSLYVDLVKEIKELKCGVNYGDLMIEILLYADDIVLLSDNPQGLQLMLDTLGEWCKKWRLVVNNTKTNIIHFRREGVDLTESKFYFWNEEVDLVHTYRYLGLVLNEFLDMSKTVDILISSAGRAYGSMLNKHFQVNGFNYETYVKLYDNLVIPVLTYGSCIWGTRNYQKCDTLQHRVMRTFLGASKATPLPALYGDLCWTPVSVFTKLESVRYWHKLCKLPDERITKKVFNIDCMVNSNRQGSWCNVIRNTLESANLHIWSNKNSTNVDLFSILEKVKIKLCNEFYTKLSGQVPDMSRLVLYQNLDVHFNTYIMETSAYCKILLNRQQRSVIAKLRHGTLPLEVELGRYRSIPKENRLCKYCNITCIETPEHFILECDRYKPERTIFMNEILKIEPLFSNVLSREKIPFLLDSKSFLILNTFSKYVLNILLKRNSSVL